MEESILEIEQALTVLREPSPWSAEIKASDAFLDRLFPTFYEKLGLPNLMRKTDYHTLAPFVAREAIDPEVSEKLDQIVAAAKRARPVQSPPSHA